MLSRVPAHGQNGRHVHRERKLWHDARTNTPALGCLSCPELQICGGLRISASFFDCLKFCCGSPDSCDRVCRNHPDFPARIREVGTFGLDNVPRATPVGLPFLPPLVPVLFHGHRRIGLLRHRVVALPLYAMFHRDGAVPRFDSYDKLCDAYRLEPGTRVILTGTSTDSPLERWWSLGEQGRRRVLRNLRSLSALLVTTPNYSLFSDQPRWSDLHAMKRIAITHAELLEEGLGAALHVNGRTDADFQRWAEYVAARREVTHLAYEFTTGTRWPSRQDQHLRWLTGLAGSVGRPLSLIIRGGVEILPELRSAFANVSILNTAIFMKTMMRRRAVEAPTSVRWVPAPTHAGAPLDELLASNLATVDALHRQVRT